MVNYLVALDEKARSILERDKAALIAKYGLVCEDGSWYSIKENAHKHLIFKDRFLRRADIVALLCRVNKLCGAKVKYLRQNIDHFIPLCHHYRLGFLEVPLWNADFLQHKASALIIDLRYLQTITEYEDFVTLCRELAAYEARQES